MDWSAEALLMIQAAPAGVQPLIRRKVESKALEQGQTSITAELITSLMAEGHAGKPDSAPGRQHDMDVERYYARRTENPLTEAFDATNDVHVFAGGRSLSPGEAKAAWREVENVVPSATRPRCLYIHIPFCVSRCVFCPFYANRWTPEAGRHYVEALQDELRRVGESPLGQTPLDAVYFGGGTPSDLAADDLAALLKTIRRHFQLTDETEVTLEGRVWGHGPDLTAAAIEGGVNRFSIGVQSFDTALRRSLGRKADCREVLTFLERLSQTPASVVIDLIYGLPGQTDALWREDLRVLNKETNIHGVDLYRLKSMPESVMEQMMTDGRLPESPDLAAAAKMFVEGVEMMREARWERLSLSHWRRGARERSLYNAMVKSGTDCIPVGCGAGGRVGGVRFFQTGDLETYISAVRQGEKPIASAVRLDEHCGLVDNMTAQLERGEIILAEWGRPPFLRETAARLLRQWMQAGLLTPGNENGDAYSLTTAGQFWHVQMGSRLAKLINEVLSYSVSMT